jgi:hypothetical protein
VQKSIQSLLKLQKRALKLHLPQEISREIFFRVASLVRKSFKMDIVDILSDLKTAQPLLEI